MKGNGTFIDELDGFIFKHGDDDYSIWRVDLTDDEKRALHDVLGPKVNEGSSVRGCGLKVDD